VSLVHQQLTGTWQNFESFSLVLSRRGCQIQEHSIATSNITKLASKQQQKSKQKKTFQKH